MTEAAEQKPPRFVTAFYPCPWCAARTRVIDDRQTTASKDVYHARACTNRDCRKQFLTRETFCGMIQSPDR